MSAELWLWIFLGIWAALVLLYVVYKICGGRLLDCFSCQCFSGPCCDCWGNGGQIDEYDRSYPFARGNIVPSLPSGGGGSNLPAIVIVNDMDSSDDGDDDEYEDGDGDESRTTGGKKRRRRKKRSYGASDADEAAEDAGPLLLQSQSRDQTEEDPVIVV